MPLTHTNARTHLESWIFAFESWSAVRVSRSSSSSSFVIAKYCGAREPTNPAHQPTNPTLDLSESWTPETELAVFGPLGALRAHTNVPQRKYLRWRTRRELEHPRVGPHRRTPHLQLHHRLRHVAVRVLLVLVELGVPRVRVGDLGFGRRVQLLRISWERKEIIGDHRVITE
jgi:hypothetical protein